MYDQPESTVIKINHIDGNCTCTRAKAAAPHRELPELPFVPVTDSRVLRVGVRPQTPPATTPVQHEVTQPTVNPFVQLMQPQVPASPRLSLQAKKSSISSSGSESTLSVVNITDEKLPVVTPRKHGPYCAIEISVMEKHREGCKHKKADREGRNPLEDTVGSYDVVNRMVFPTCENKHDKLQHSRKSFKLNDPIFFGKDLTENRSKIEAMPILPDYSSAVLFSDPSHQQKDMDSLSVYIRMNKNEKVPPGFQKMHYRGDSCKLHDPTQRSKQIMALQKVINETSSGANLNKSSKKFSVSREPYIMTAVTSPARLPPEILSIKTSGKSKASVETPTKNKTPSSQSPDDTIDTFHAEDSDDTIKFYNAGRNAAPYVDSLEVMSQKHHGEVIEPTRGNSGLFGCFKKKPRRPTDSLDEERGPYYDNHQRSQSPTNTRRFSAQYKK